MRDTEQYLAQITGLDYTWEFVDITYAILSLKVRTTGNGLILSGRLFYVSDNNSKYTASNTTMDGKWPDEIGFEMTVV
jgi:hypothetical protein